jgi:hypothetical protein
VALVVFGVRNGCARWPRSELNAGEQPAGPKADVRTRVILNDEWRMARGAVMLSNDEPPAF